jgi:hypothetical protein
LSANLVQLHRLHAGMTLDGEQRIRCLHRTMLPGVAGENDAGIPFFGQTEQCQHLPPANLASLIHDDDGRSGNSALVRKLATVTGDGKPAFSISTTC